MRDNQGFTLIEMMVVIGIAAIISAIAIPNVYSWVSTQRFNSAVRDIQATIESTRLAAVKENSEAVVSFTSGANSYRSQVLKRGFSAADQPAPKTHRLPPGITVSPTADIEFSSRGTANTPNTITVNGPKGLSLNVVVNITGSSIIE